MDGFDLALLPRLIISGSGLDPEPLARQAGIPGRALRTDHARITGDRYLRAWELVEHGVDHREIALMIAERYVVGALGLYDYLFITAPTLWDGMAATGTYMNTISTNWRFEPAEETDREFSFTVHLNTGEGRGADLAMQFWIAGAFSRARTATGRPVNPVQVALRQPAPRRHDAFHAFFQTDQVDFGAPADTVTMRKSDLDLPLLGADSLLARILRYQAESLPPLPVRTTWLDQFRRLLRDSLMTGPTIAAVAARLATSPRTLQRRLAAHGTTWREELDRVRRSEYHRMRPAGLNSLARRLGYSDARSLSRANRRWQTR
ncbi:AraC family transcriptional regulator ligand-binding domain-containing protein [Nonomuraea sp. KM90]|uniref:AraC family transcriptional regulator ligand-binding domain-containing protein n=1 Tax=Nonomuraea sp. KM90 TaxID=3457428 RepID=UPI003FCD2C79